MTVIDRVQSATTVQDMTLVRHVGHANQVTSDPLFGAMTSLLSIPLFQLYAVMLRVGILTTSK